MMKSINDRIKNGSVVNPVLRWKSDDPAGTMRVESYMVEPDEGYDIHPDYRNTGAFKFLFDAFVSHILKLGEKGVVVGKMLADAVSPVGEKVCKLLGMTRIGDTTHGSVLYEVSGLHLN